MSDQAKQNISRRDFIRQSAELAGAAIIGAELIAPAEAAPVVRTASDWVQLGRLNKHNIKIPRLGMGTGTVNGKAQRDLGAEGFNSLVKYAYDRGVRYIDTADNYKTHEFIREAIKANKLPRENLFIQTKLPLGAETTADPMKTIDRYRQELGVDYIDSLLMARINPQGRHVDSDHPTNPHHPEGKVAEAMKEIKAMHDKGRGVIGMKIIGEGFFASPEDREKSIRYAMAYGFVDAVVIGFKSTAEIDEAVERINRALK